MPCHLLECVAVFLQETDRVTPCVWSGMAPGVWGEPFCVRQMLPCVALGPLGSTQSHKIPLQLFRAVFLFFFAFLPSTLLNRALRLLLFLKPKPVAAVSVGW